MSAAEQVNSIDKNEATRWEGAKPAATTPATAKNEGAVSEPTRAFAGAAGRAAGTHPSLSIAGQEG